MQGAEGARRDALSAMRVAFARRREIGPEGRFSTLNTSPYVRLRLRWESVGLYEDGKK
jgi:hypothetical protein